MKPRSDLSALPEPPTRPGNGHLQDWALRPLALIEDGAHRSAAGGLFRLRLGLPAVVGFSPAWNRALLTDLHTFRSAGSFSRVVPYLSGGVILTDAPAHAPRRKMVNPGFGKRHMDTLRERVRAALPSVPTGSGTAGEWDALAWADAAALHMLNAAYFSGEFDPGLLHAFLAPLRHPFPVPALPRPLLFARVDAELRRLAHKRLTTGRRGRSAGVAGPPSRRAGRNADQPRGGPRHHHARAGLGHLAPRPQPRMARACTSRSRPEGSAAPVSPRLDGQPPPIP